MERSGFSNQFMEGLQSVGGLRGILNLGMAIKRVGAGYKQGIQEGSSPFEAFVGSAGRFAVYSMHPSLMWANMAATYIPQVMQAREAALAKRQNWWDNMKYPNMGVWFDTESALTMRQASEQAIQESQMNARFVLGNEARMMHS